MLGFPVNKIRIENSICVYFVTLQVMIFQYHFKYLQKDSFGLFGNPNTFVTLIKILEKYENNNEI